MKKYRLIIGMLLTAMLCCGCSGESAEKDKDDTVTEVDGDKGGSSDSKKEDKKDIDPFVVTVNGKQYKITADSGIENFQEITPAGIFIGPKPNQPEAVLFEKGKTTSEKTDIENIRALMPQSQIIYAPIGRGNMNTSFGYREYNGLPYFTGTDFHTDCASYSFGFVNDFDYQGINQKSTDEEIKNEGFREGYDSTYYYQIVSDRKVDWSAVEKKYDDLLAEAITTVDLYKNTAEAFPGSESYMVGLSSLTMGDVYKTEVGISEKDEEIFNSKAQSVKVSKLDNPCKENRMTALAIGEQMQALDKGEIDKFAVVVVRKYGVGFPDPDMNALFVVVFTKLDNIQTWPAKWGFE